MGDHFQMIAGETDPKRLLIWWIEERWRILQRRLCDAEKPWSEDPVFQSTYFCNVRREDDKTTKFMRRFYAPFHDDKMYEYNVIFSRFVNWPQTVLDVGYMSEHNPVRLLNILMNKASYSEQIWSGAYIITTHGIPMPKVTYLAQNVLGGVFDRLDWLRASCRHTTVPPLLRNAHAALMRFEGLGSFMAAQIVADLKNTKGHQLEHAADWWSFVAPGPGSIRGLEWFHGGKRQFDQGFRECREYVDAYLNYSLLPRFCDQDLQNCLCEFDKYMRVRNGTGKSKRNYDGRGS